MEWILKLPDVNWNWNVISGNPNVSLQWLETFPNAPWNWNTVYHNHYSCLSLNPNLSLEWLTRFPEKSWNWDLINCHPDITSKWIETFPDKLNEAKMINGFIFNKKLKLKHIKNEPNYLKPLYEDTIYTFGYFEDKKEFDSEYLQNYLKKYGAIIRIQYWWKRIYYDPQSQVRKRILNEQYTQYTTNLQQIIATRTN